MSGNFTRESGCASLKRYKYPESLDCVTWHDACSLTINRNATYAKRRIIMKKIGMAIIAMILMLFLAGESLWADNIFSSTSTMTGASTLINFEGYGENDVISSISGVTFGQTPLVGNPQIDNWDAVGQWKYAYGSSSGVGVLTGSKDGYPFPTIAGITMTFGTPVYEFETFFSDTDPLGHYTVEAYGPSGLIGSFELILSTVFDMNGDVLFPTPSTTPHPGYYVGFRNIGNITSIHIGPDDT